MYFFLNIAVWGFLLSLALAFAFYRRCRVPMARFFIRAAPICWGCWLVWEALMAGAGYRLRVDLLLVLPIVGIVTLGAVLSWAVALFLMWREDG